MEYRIEELSRAAGVAVDTVRFYQGRGLLDPPRREGRVTYYAAAHLERLTRIRGLQSRGFNLAVIKRFLDGELGEDDIDLVAAVTTPSVPDTLTLEELAHRSGIAVPLLQPLVAAGLLVTSGGEGRFPAEDVQVLAAGLKLVEAGIPLTALIELASQHNANTEAVARRAVELFDRHIRESGGTSNLVETFEQLLDATTLLVGAHFRQVLLRAAREHIERQS